MELKISNDMVVQQMKPDRVKMFKPQGPSPDAVLTYGQVPVGGTFTLDGKLMRKMEGGARSARGRSPKELMKVEMSMIVGRPPTIV